MNVDTKIHTMKSKAKDKEKKYKQIGFYLEPALYKKVITKCQKKGVWVSEISRDLLDLWTRDKIKITKSV